MKRKKQLKVMYTRKIFGKQYDRFRVYVSGVELQLGKDFEVNGSSIIIK